MSSGDTAITAAIAWLTSRWSQLIADEILAMRATYTYVEYSDGTREHYDRSTDPAELHNTAAALPAATRSALHTDLAAMTSCHGQSAC